MVSATKFTVGDRVEYTIVGTVKKVDESGEKQVLTVELDGDATHTGRDGTEAPLIVELTPNDRGPRRVVDVDPFTGQPIVEDASGDRQ